MFSGENKAYKRLEGNLIRCAFLYASHQFWSQSVLHIATDVSILHLQLPQQTRGSIYSKAIGGVTDYSAIVTAGEGEYSYGICSAST